MMPAISLVVPCYDEAALLPRLLVSVDAARRRFDQALLAYIDADSSGRAPRGKRARDAALNVVLSERQIQAPRQAELGRRRAGDDPRHAVVAQPRRAAEDERVA